MNFPCSIAPYDCILHVIQNNEYTFINIGIIIVGLVILLILKKLGGARLLLACLRSIVHYETPEFHDPQDTEPASRASTNMEEIDETGVDVHVEPDETGADVHGEPDETEVDLPVNHNNDLIDENPEPTIREVELKHYDQIIDFVNYPNSFSSRLLLIVKLYLEIQKCTDDSQRKALEGNLHEELYDFNNNPWFVPESVSPGFIRELLIKTKGIDLLINSHICDKKGEIVEDQLCSLVKNIFSLITDRHEEGINDS